MYVLDADDEDSDTMYMRQRASEMTVELVTAIRKYQMA